MERELTKKQLKKIISVFKRHDLYKTWTGKINLSLDLHGNPKTIEEDENGGNVNYTIKYSNIVGLILTLLCIKYDESFKLYHPTFDQYKTENFISPQGILQTIFQAMTRNFLCIPYEIFPRERAYLLILKICEKHISINDNDIEDYKIGLSNNFHKLLNELIKILGIDFDVIVSKSLLDPTPAPDKTTRKLFSTRLVLGHDYTDLFKFTNNIYENFYTDYKDICKEYEKKEKYRNEHLEELPPVE